MLIPVKCAECWAQGWVAGQQQLYGIHAWEQAMSCRQHAAQRIPQSAESTAGSSTTDAGQDKGGLSSLSLCWHVHMLTPGHALLDCCCDVLTGLHPDVNQLQLTRLLTILHTVLTMQFVHLGVLPVKRSCSVLASQLKGRQLVARWRWGLSQFS